MSIISKYFRPERGLGKELKDFDAGSMARSPRFVIGSLEGARFVPSDIESSDELLDDLEALMDIQLHSSV